MTEGSVQLPERRRASRAPRSLNRQLHGLQALRGTVARGERHARWLRYLADRLSRGDRDLRDDLVQEGLIALWQSPLATAALSPEAAPRVERRVVANRMKAFVRSERRALRRSWRAPVALQMTEGGR